MYHRRLLLTLRLHSHALRTTVIPTLNSGKVEFTKELRNFLIRDSNLDISGSYGPKKSVYGP